MVTTVSFKAILEVILILYTWNDNIWGLVPYLYAVIAPENLQCVNGLKIKFTQMEIIYSNPSL